MSPVTTRVDGFLPLAGYAALGDGRSVALVGADGRIDWWPIPALDSPPGFAAVLDPDRGGYLALCPQAPAEVTRRYLDGTNVLCTTFETEHGAVEVQDALIIGQSGPLPWTELQRRVRALRGSVAMRWELLPGDRFGSVRPWAQPDPAGALVHIGDQHLAVHGFGIGQFEVEHARVSGEFELAAGDEGVLVVTAVDDEPVFVPHRRHLDRRFAATVAWWRAWSDAIDYDGRWSDQVRRSALALKLLCYQPTGAIAAAATTSLPERLGGDKNWDYRYGWLRDCSFSVDALLSLHLEEEVHSSVSWVLAALAGTMPQLGVFYRLDRGLPEQQAAEVPSRGYRGSRPVRSGNGAAGQSQLGVFGDLFAMLWRYVEDGNRIDDATARLLAELADQCCDRWPDKDSGIWELHELRHYTISKMGCWTALDRACRLADAGQLPARRAQRWAGERDAVRDWVHRHCWSEQRSTYTFYAGGDELDAAVLLAGMTGFDRGPRLAGTVAAVRAELADGPLVYRYSGMREEEGAFLACTFWLVDALARVGQLDEARELMDAAVALPNDLGLMSEQMDPADRSMLGNLPQGLSHLALINAAVSLDGAGGGPAAGDLR